jgi:hypothetical protein
MKIEKQKIPLELVKRLKQLGIKQIVFSDNEKTTTPEKTSTMVCRPVHVGCLKGAIGSTLILIRASRPQMSIGFAPILRS